MQLEDEPVKKHYSIWSIAGMFAAVGVLVTVFIFGSGISPILWDFVCRHSDVMLVLCPPSIVSMAMDHIHGMEEAEIVAVIAVENSALYFVVGLFLAILWKTFQRFSAKRGIDGTEE
ncbi:MAG: hypothetical protein P4K80_00120 [Acidobacteriaceae bacterium]|nr:hypothetical protein [Acidobacteriaceae bacterium]